MTYEVKITKNLWRTRMNKKSIGMALSCLFLAPCLGLADERLFTYTYQAEVLPKGALEFEQWITNRNGRASGVYSAFDLREEFEAGLTDKLTTAVYLNTKSEYQS